MSNTLVVQVLDDLMLVCQRVVKEIIIKGKEMATNDVIPSAVALKEFLFFFHFSCEGNEGSHERSVGALFLSFSYSFRVKFEGKESGVKFEGSLRSKEERKNKLKLHGQIDR